jgi:hypothetical protein
MCIIVVWLCVLLLVGRVNCCLLAVCVVVGWWCVLFLVGCVYFCWLVVCTVPGRPIYCFWLAVRIVLYLPCVLLFGLYIIDGCPCVFLLVGRVNFCLFAVRNCSCFSLCIVVVGLA